MYFWVIKVMDILIHWRIKGGGGVPGTHAPPLGKNVKWVELPSGCVVPGSWSGLWL